MLETRASIRSVTVLAEGLGGGRYLCSARSTPRHRAASGAVRSSAQMSLSQRPMTHGGDVATTDAVRRPARSTRFSPTTSHGPIERIATSPAIPSAVTDSIAHTAWPKSPSAASAPPPRPDPGRDRSQCGALDVRETGEQRDRRDARRVHAADPGPARSRSRRRPVTRSKSALMHSLRRQLAERDVIPARSRLERGRSGST